jgi:hypothetical protein
MSTTAQLIDSLYRTYHIMTSQAKMPSKCWGRYTYSAVVSVRRGGRVPRQIRNTRDAIVIFASNPGFAGKTDRCAAERFHERAVEIADNREALNAAWRERVAGTDVC